MHEKVKAAFNEIDSAIFNGDTFHEPYALEDLKIYLARWSQRLPFLESMAALQTAEEEDEDAQNDD